MSPWRLILLICLLLYALCPLPGWAGVQCDGTDDIVTTTGTAGTFFPGTHPTMTAWVKPAGSATGSVSNALQGQIIVGDTDGRIGLTRATVGSDQLWAANYQSPTVYQIGGTFTVNTWNHVALVQAAGGLTFYLNGVAQGTDSGVTDINFSSPTLQLCFGGNVGHTWDGLRYSGQVTDVRFYDAALTASQIEVMAAGRLATYATEGTGYWSFEQCADNTGGNGVAFVDRSGNGRVMTGSFGANTSGLTCRASEALSQPWGAQ